MIDNNELMRKLSELTGESGEDISLLAEALTDNSNEMFGLPEDYSPDRSKKEYSSELKEKLNRLFAAINSEIPPRLCMRLSPVRGECTVFDSKLGGTPYFPKNMEYPTVREGELKGRPLRLLAQLNFGTLPHIEGFPENGILQFFAGCDDDDVVGLDFKDYFNQNGFRVIYHEQVSEDVSQLISEEDMPKFDPEDYNFPFNGEFLLNASAVELSGISSADYRFENTVVRCCNQLFGWNIVSLYGSERRNELVLRMVDEELYNALYDTAEGGTGSRIGGFPYFTQEDPRGYNEDYARCDTLLFQLDTEGDGEDEIMWGDCGVGNFFISSEDMKKLDFSHVLYTWDCC